VRETGIDERGGRDGLERLRGDCDGNLSFR
jgi:hypothetical protein